MIPSQMLQNYHMTTRNALIRAYFKPVLDVVFDSFYVSFIPSFRNVTFKAGVATSLIDY